MENLVSFISYMALVSMAAERFTELLKKFWLEKYKIKSAVYQAIAGGFGAALCFIEAPAALPFKANEYVLCLVIGLVVSAGSGVWNDALSTIKSLRDGLKAKA